MGAGFIFCRLQKPAPLDTLRRNYKTYMEGYA